MRILLSIMALALVTSLTFADSLPMSTLDTKPLPQSTLELVSLPQSTLDDTPQACNCPNGDKCICPPGKCICASLVGGVGTPVNYDVLTVQRPQLPASSLQTAPVCVDGVCNVVGSPTSPGFYRIVNRSQRVGGQPQMVASYYVGDCQSGNCGTQGTRLVYAGDVPYTSEVTYAAESAPVRRGLFGRLRARRAGGGGGCCGK